MRSPQSAVWLTWRTRPLMWFLPVFLLPLGLVPLTGNTNRQIAPSPDWPHRGVLMSATRLREYLDTGQVDASVRSISFRYMRETDGTSPLISVDDLTDPAIDVQKVFLQFPNLEAIQFCGDQIRSLRADTLRGLNSVHNVSIASEEVTENDLKQLTLLPNLQHLKISSSQTTVDLRQLSKCRHLRSIEIDPGYVEQDSQSDGEPVCSIASIAQLAAIPNLRILTIPGGPMLGRSNFTLESLTEVQREEVRTLAAGLAESSHLNRLFIGTGRGEGSLETVRILRKQLPQMTVLPAMYSERRVQFLSIMSFALWVVVLFIVFQAIGQLSGPLSLLIPQYREQHLKTTGMTLGIVVLATTVGAWSAGIAWFVAPGLILTLSAVTMGIVTSIWNGRSSSLPRSKTLASHIPASLRVVFLISLFLLPTGLQHISPWVNWFLAGEQPWPALALAAVGPVILYYSFNQLYRCHRLQAEAGMPQAVTAEEVGKAPQYVAASNTARRDATGRDARWSRNIENCVASLRNQSSGSQATWTKWRLWLLGSVSYSLLFGLIVVLIVCAAINVRNVADMRVASLARQLLMSQACRAAVQGIPILLGIFLWQRRSLFSIEILRPVTRNGWIDTTLGAIWWLNLRLCGVVWLIVVMLRVVAGIPTIDIWTIVECLAVLAGATFCAGLALWSVGANRVWVAAIGIFAVAISSTLTAEVILVRDSSNFSIAALSYPYAAIGSGFGAVCGGLILMAKVRRYWLTLELAPSAD